MTPGQSGSGTDNTAGLIEQRTVGASGVRVSVLGLGTAPLGGLFEASSDEAARATVRAAVMGGITHFDTAPAYGSGLAEERLGKALRAEMAAGFRPAVSTKVGRLLVRGLGHDSGSHWAEKNNFDIRYDASGDAITASVEESLERTGLKKFDILLLHDPDRYASDDSALDNLLAEAYSTLHQLRQQGLVSAIGIGVNSAKPCLRALEIGKWDCFMLAGTYSVLSQKDDGLLDACQKRDTSVMVAAPFLSGVLAGGKHWRYGPIPEEVRRRVQLLNRICQRHDIATEAAALQFPLFHPAVCNVVIGMRAATEVNHNLAHLQTEIPMALWVELTENGFISQGHFHQINAAGG